MRKRSKERSADGAKEDDRSGVATRQRRRQTRGFAAANEADVPKKSQDAIFSNLLRLAERVRLAAGHFDPLGLELLMQAGEEPATADAEQHCENRNRAVVELKRAQRLRRGLRE